MSEFQKELIKILLDKVLLGLIAMAFGYYLSRLLENYRTKKSYENFVWQQRVDTCRLVSKLVSEHFRSLMGVYDMLNRLAEKYPVHLSKEEAKPGYKFIEDYEKFSVEVRALTPFFTGELADAAIRYLDKTGKITAIIKGEFPAKLPSKEDLHLAVAEFFQACSAVITAGPYATPKIERRNNIS